MNALEQEVVEQFLDTEFEPNDYVDSLISICIENEDLKSTFIKTNALSNILNDFTYQLTQQFDQRYKELLESSSIVSYTNEDEEGITRLQFQLSTLRSAMESLGDDIEVTREEVEESVKDVSVLHEFESLQEVKNRIGQVLDVFDQLKSLLDSGEFENESDMKRMTHAQFKSAVTILKSLILKQLEDKTVQHEKILEIVDNLISLQPMFESFVHFEPIYTELVEILKAKKRNLQC